MKKSLLLLAIIVALGSCKENKKAEEPSPKPEKKEVIDHSGPTETTSNSEMKKEAKGPSIDNLAEWPNKIAGCSCYASSNKSEFEKENFIYVHTYENLAIFKIDGTEMEFSKSSETSENDWKNVESHWDNDNYSVTLITEEVSKSGETKQHKGTMTVKDKKDQSKTQIEIYGECGC